MKYKRYNTDLDYSYTLGIYPTIELLKNQAKFVVKIVLHSKFSSEKGSLIIKDYTAKYGIEIEHSDRLIQTLSPKENCYAIGVFKKYHQTLNNQSNHVVLVNPRNPGNLGTTIRYMLAFDFLDLAVIKPAVDNFNPESIRSSMGALFSIRLQLFNNIDDYLGSYGTRDFFSLMTNGTNILGETKFNKPYSLIFGNESSGLPDSYRDISKPVLIPQSKKVDSLNLAISSSIVLYHLYEQSRKKFPTQGDVALSLGE